MFILLPPSEGKAAPRSGAPLDLAGLSLPALGDARHAVLEALVKVSGDEPEALAVLGLTGGQVEEVRRNARLRTAGTLPAAKLYTGVLYEALGLATLPPAARRRANRSVLVFSGLWGVLRLTDRVPPYRCSIGANLPGVGPLGSHWKAALRVPLNDLTGTDLVLDLRSAAYAATWSAPGAVTVRVLHEREVDGRPVRSVVSHFNKAVKGRLVRDLLQLPASPRTAPRLLAALRDLGHVVEERSPTGFDVVVRSLQGSVVPGR